MTKRKQKAYELATQTRKEHFKMFKHKGSWAFVEITVVTGLFFGVNSMVAHAQTGDAASVTTSSTKTTTDNLESVTSSANVVSNSSDTTSTGQGDTDSSSVSAETVTDNSNTGQNNTQSETNTATSTTNDSGTSLNNETNTSESNNSQTSTTAQVAPTVAYKSMQTTASTPTTATTTATNQVTTANLNGTNIANVNADGTISTTDVNKVTYNSIKEIEDNFTAAETVKVGTVLTTTDLSSQIASGTVTLVPKGTKIASGKLVFNNQVDTSQPFTYTATLSTNNPAGGGGIGIILQPVEPAQVGIGTSSDPGINLGIETLPNTIFAGRDGFQGAAGDQAYNILTIRSTDSAGKLNASTPIWKDSSNPTKVTNTEYVILNWTPTVINNDNTVAGALQYTTYSDAAYTNKIQSVTASNLVLNRSEAIAAFGAVGNDTGTSRSVSNPTFTATIASMPVTINYVNVDTGSTISTSDVTNVNIGESLTIADTTDLSTNTVAPKVIDGYRFVKAISGDGSSTVNVTNSVLNAGTSSSSANSITLYYTNQNTYTIQPVDGAGNNISGLDALSTTGTIGSSVATPVYAGYTAASSTVTVPTTNGATVKVLYVAQKAGTVTVQYVGANGSSLPASVQPASVTLDSGTLGGSFIVASPLIAGYVASQSAISGTYTTDAQTITVTYTPTNNAYTITPVDTNGNPIAGLAPTGGNTVTGQTITLPDYSAQGYRLVSGQSYTVQPGVINYNVQYLPMTATITVNYIVKNYNGDTTSTTQTMQTVATGNSYNIDTPVIAGYTPDITAVTGVYGFTGSASRQTTFTVTYTPNWVTVSYVFTGLDNATLKVAQATPQGQTTQMPVGTPNTVIAPDLSTYGYTYVQRMQIVPISADPSANVIVIAYKGNPTQITVNYVDTTGKVLSPATTQTGIVGGSYTITSPTVTGYTPNQATVSGTYTVANQTANNSQLTVTYKANTTLVAYTIQPVDAKGNKISSLTPVTGYAAVGTVITAPDYTNQGYQLVTPSTVTVSSTSNQTLNVTYAQLVNYTLQPVDASGNAITTLPTSTGKGVAGKSITPPTYTGYNVNGTYTVPTASGVVKVTYTPKTMTVTMTPVDGNGNVISDLAVTTYTNMAGGTIINTYPTYAGYQLKTTGSVTVPISDNSTYNIQVTYLKQATINVTGTSSATYTGDVQAPILANYTLTLPDGRTYTLSASDITAIDANGQATNAIDSGAYSVGLTSSALAAIQAQLANNYVITAASPTATFTINKKAGTATIGTGQKPYDNNPQTNQTVYTVTMPTGETAPTMTADDFDITGINSQDVGNYTIKLSDAGLAKLNEASKNFSFTQDDVKAGSFKITQATGTVSITGYARDFDGSTDVDISKLAVSVPSGAKTPTWTAADFDLSAVTSANVGNYNVTLSAKGLEDLNAVNTNFSFAAGNLASGTFQILPAKATVTIGNHEKNYDNNAATDPSMYDVALSEGLVAPTWTADDFDLSGITSQNAGSYTVKLSDTGLQKLKAANRNYAIDASVVTAGQFTINKAKVTLTVPTESVAYTGKAFSALTPVIGGVPEKGESLKYTLTDISKAIQVGMYPVTATVNQTDNPNYQVTVTPGSLTITPISGDVIIGSGQKPYDGDVNTDPKIFDVTLPNLAIAPTWTAADFDLSGITSQNVGSYSVTLSNQGLTDLNKINPNFVFTKADIKAGTFTINKAPITITAPTLSKTYDGKAYISADAKAKVIVTKPALGVAPVYSLTDTSEMIKADTYGLTITPDANQNSNYDITVQPGQLTITQARGTASVVSTSKPWDNNAATDPTTFDVKVADGLTNPTNWEASDFDVTGIASQNVGSYPVKLTAAGISKLEAVNPNYTFTNGITDGTFTIAQLIPQILIGDGSKVYDGVVGTEDKVFDVTFDSKIAGLIKMPTFAATDFDTSDVGTNANIYTVTLNGQGLAKLQELNPNVAFKSENLVAGHFTILKRPATITGPTMTKDYGTSDFTTTQDVVTTGVVDGETLSYSLADKTKSDVGTHDLDVIAGDNPNYTVTTQSGHYVITPATATIQIGNATKVYDGTATKDPTIFTVTLPDGVKAPSWRAVDFDLSDITSQDVGNYVIKLSQTGLDDLNAQNSNYLFTQDNVNAGTFSITKAPITITANGIVKTYDGQPASAPTATVSGQTANMVDVVYSLNTEELQNDIDAGNYDITVTALENENKNYTITTKPAKLLINKQAIGATLGTVTKTYDNDSSQDPKQVTVTLADGLTAPTWTDDDFVFATHDQSVGNYAVTLSDKGIDALNTANSNYTFEKSLVVAGVFSITQAVGSMTIKPRSKEYDGDTSTDPADNELEVALPTNAIRPEWQAGDFTGLTNENVGGYNITLTAQGLKRLQDANPNFSFEASSITAGIFSITPAEITIQAPTLTKVYDGQAYQGTISATVTGVPTKGVTPVYTFSDISKQTNVTTTPVAIKVIPTDGADSNYKITTIPGQLTITPADATITAITGTKVYDGNTDVADSDFTVTLGQGLVAPAGGFAAADFDVDGITSADVGTSYSISLNENGQVRLADANPNYTIMNAGLTGNFTITPATATASIDGVNKVYDGDSSTDPTQYTVEVNSVDGQEQPVTLDAKYFAIKNASQNVGNYAVSLTGEGLAELQTQFPNYTIGQVSDGQYTIKQAQITGSLSDWTDIFGQPHKMVNQVQWTNFPVNGDKPVYTITDTTDFTAVGNYQVVITASQADNPNYLIKTTPATYHIVKAEGTATIEAAAKIFDNNQTTDPATYTVTLNSGATNVAWTAEDFADDNATDQNVNSVHHITLTTAGLAKLNDANQNYFFTGSTEANTTTGSMTITPRPVKITAPTITKTYDGTPYSGEVTAQVDGQIDSSPVVYHLDSVSDDIDQGNYTIGVTYDKSANTNYTITDEDGSLTINPVLTTVTVNASGKTYNGENTVETSKLSVSLPDGLTAPEFSASDFDLNNVGTDVGDYQISLKQAGIDKLNTINKNYQFDLSRVNSGTFSIQQAVGKATIHGGEAVYNGDASTDPKTFDVTFDSNEVTPEGGWIASDFTGITGQNVGSYDIKLTQSGLNRLNAANPNYIFNQGDITRGQYVITTAEVTITAPTLTKIYDGKDYSGDYQATITGQPASGDKLVYTLTDIKDITDVPETPLVITVDPGENPNYTVKTVDGQLTITPASASVQSITGGKVYDGFGVTSATGINVSLSAGIVPPENGWQLADFDVSGVGTDAGTYTINLSDSGLSRLQQQNPNYAITDDTTSVTGNYQILKADANAQIVSPKDNKVYDGTSSADPTSYDIIINGDQNQKVTLDKSYFTDNNGKEDVGTYTIALTEAGLNELNVKVPNYNFTAASVKTGSFKITPAPVTLSFSSWSDDYGQPTTLSNRQTIIYNGKPEKGTDIKASLTDNSMDKNAGTYTIDISVDANANPNYTISTQSGTYTVNQIPGSVTISNKTKTYDGDVSTDPDIYDVQLNDGATDINWQAEDFEDTNADDPNVGSTHTITLSQSGLDRLNAANRNFKFNASVVTSGTLTINKAPITITAPTVSKIYDGQAYGALPAATVVGLPATGVALNYSLTDVSGDTEANEGYVIDILNYEDNNPNYQITLVAGKLTIQKQSVTATVRDYTRPYDATKNVGWQTLVTLPVDTNLPSDWSEADFDFSAVESDAGSYAITLNQVGINALNTANPNYQFDLATTKAGTMTISKAPGKLQISGGEKVYDGDSTNVPSVFDVTLLENDQTQIDWQAGDFTGITSSNAGTYKVTLSATGLARLNAADKNYQFTSESITPGSYKIDVRNITITAPTLTKVFDGNPYQGDYAATITNTSDGLALPSTAVKPTYTLTDITKDSDATDKPITITVDADANANYIITPVSGSLTITKAPMSITSITGGKVYDGQELTNMRDITVTVPDQLKQVDWDVSDFTVTDSSADKGQYTIALSQTGQNKLAAANPNYDIQNLDITGQYVITQAVGTARLDTSAEKPYDGLDSTNPSTFNLYVNGDTTTPIQLTSNQFVIAGNSQNVGTYTVSLTSDGLKALETAYPNYTFKDTDIQNGSFTITPKAITITAPTWSDTYGEKGTIPSWTANKTLTGVQPDVTISPTADIKNAGQYGITISYQADSAVNRNYIITILPGEYTIKKATGSVTIANASKVYDGDVTTDAQIYQVTLNNADANNVNWATTDFSVDNSEGQNVGSEHTITLSAAGLAKLNTANTNYAYDASSVQAGTLTISKAQVQIVGPSVSKVYDGNAYDQSKFEQAVQVTGQAAHGDKVIYTVADMSQNKDAGKDYTIAITATAEDNPNYDITEITNGTLTITPKPISVNLSSGSTTYGDDDFDATTMLPSISTGETLNIPSDWTNADYALPDLTSSNVGDYTVTLSSDGVEALKDANPNYEFDNASGTLTIDKKQISITAVSGTKVYDGTTLTDPSTISVTLSDGLVTPPLTSKDFDINIAASGDVGKYDIKLNTQGIKDLNTIYPNYDFSAERMVTGSYEITKAPITITAPNVTKQYDGNGYDKPLTPTFIGLPTSGVTPDYLITGKDAVDAGQHDLLVSADANSNPNYTITTNPGKLTITQKPVTAEMGTNSVVYDGRTYVDQKPIFQFTDSDGNIVDGNTHSLTSDDIQVDGGSDFAKTVNVGKYVVQLTTAGIQKLRDANPNYDLTIINGGYWVTPATKHLTVIGGTRLYDGTTGVTSADQFTIQASDGVVIPDFTSDAFDTSQVGWDAGRYNIKLTTTGLQELNEANKNYQFTLSDIDDGTYTIIPKSVTVTGPDYEDQAYTGEPITSVMNSTISGLVQGDSLTITEPDLSQVINVGTYTLTPTADPNPNYNITVVPTTVIINKATVHVYFSKDGLGKYYDGDTSIVPQTFALTADNADFKIPEMTLNDFDTTGITSQNVDDYPVVLSAAGLAKLATANPNYEVDANVGLFAIVKAPVIITMPNIVKQYDGQPVTDLTDQIDISGVPAKGVKLVYTPTDVSQVTKVNTDLPLTLTATYDESTNSNYDIQVTPGTLTINRADGSAKIEGGTQTYDGTLPTVFTVTLPTLIASQAPISWDASDFVVTNPTGLTNGQVGDYTVNLSDAGLAKLNTTFTNYQFTPDSIQPGTYHVTPATGNITIGTTQMVYAKDADLKAGLASLVTVTDKTAQIDWTDDDFVVTPAEGQADGSVGRYSVTLSDAGLAKLAAASPNYQYGRDHETAGTLNVTAAHGTITLGTASKVYDGEKYVVGAVPSVTLPDGVILPATIAQTPNDFDFDAIPSQNVGSYDLSLSQAGIDAINAANPNYFFTLSDVVAGKYTITRAPITINAPTITKVYDGLSYEGDDANAMVYGMPNYGEPLRITFTDISNDVNVGEYDLGVSAHEYLNPNYSFTVNPGKLTITKALGVVTSMTATKVYDGDATTDPTVLQVTLPEGEVAPEWTAEDFDFSHVDSQNAGRYEVQLTQAGVAALNAVNPNYNFTTETIAPGTFTITPATITLSVPTMTKTFDGTSYSETTKVDVAGLPAMGVIPVAELSDYSQLIAAGTYPVSVIANAADNPNYTLNLVAGNLVIKQANGTAVISGSGKTYDHDATKLPTDLTVKLPELAVSPKWTQADFDFSGITDQSVGTYSINLSQQGLAKLNAVNPNYVFDGAAGSYTISPAEASVTVSDATKAYDGDADHLPTGLSVTLPDGLETPVLDSSDFDYTGITSQNVGHYQLTLSDAGIDKLNQVNPNYHFDLNNVTPGDYTITPAKLKVGDVSLTVSDKQYDGHGLTDLPKVYLFKEQVLAAWTTKDFTTTANPDVGTYTVTLSQSGLDKLSTQYPNYVFNVNAVTAGRYQITPQPVINQIFVGDGSKVYDGTTHLSKLVQVTLPTGWVSPDWSSEDFTRLSNSHVGDSEIGLSQAGLTQLAELNPNYDVTQASVVKGIYHVTPAIATIVVDNQTRAEDASDGPLSASVTGVVTGDVLNYQLTRQAGQTVGQYPISVVLGDNPDYHVLVVPGVLTITTATTSNNEGGSGTQQPSGKPTTDNQTGGNDQSNPTKPDNGHTTKPGDIGGTIHKPAHIKAEKPQAQLHPATKQVSGQRSKQGAANGELTSTGRMPAGNSWSTHPAQPFVHQHHDAIQQAAEDQATGKQTVLPRTDETKDSPLVFIGSLLLSLLGLSGVRRKKKQD